MKLAGKCGYKACFRPAHAMCSVAEAEDRKPRNCAGLICADHNGKVVRSREFTGVLHPEKCAGCAQQFDAEVE